MEGLAKAREIRRTKVKVNVDQLPAAAKLGDLIRCDVNKLNPRVQDYVRRLEADPGAITATMLGMLLAELDSSNQAIAQIWAWIDTYLKNGGDEGAPGNPFHITKLLGELRQWSEMLHNTAIKVTELQTKNNPQGPINPLDSYDDTSDDDNDDDDAPIGISDNNIEDT